MNPIVVALALVIGTVFAAPSPAQQAQAQPTEPAHKIFVLTGCLTGGGPAETAPFKLTGAVPKGQAPPDRSTNPDAKDVYELLPTTGLTEQGVARAELQNHVGKKVEVTLRPVEVAPGPSSSSSSSTVTTTKVEHATPQRYTVTEIKSIANSCL